MNCKTFDSIITDIVHPFGRWQIVTYLCMVLPMCCPLDMVLVFINISPPHYPCLKNYTTTDRGLLEEVPPPVDSCSYNNTDRTNHANLSSQQICNNGYIFFTNKREHVGTITEEFYLVCNRAYIRSLSPMIFMLGQCISCLISGWAADKYGRRSIVIVTGIGQFVLAILTPLSPNIELFLILQFLNGFVNIAIFNACFILMMEITDSKYRNILAMIMAINTGVFNYTLASLGSYLSQNWRFFYFMMSVVALPSILFPFLISESPRWLLVVGKRAAALVILKSAAKRNNGGTLSEDNQKQLEDFVATYQNDSNKLCKSRNNSFKVNCGRIMKSISLVFTSTSIRKRMLPLIYLWLQTSFVYYGTLFNSVQIGGNPYIVFWMAGIMMAPAGVLRFIFSRCVENKRLLMVLEIFSTISFGIMFCCQVWINSEQFSIIVVIAAIVSKFQMDMLFNLLYVYSPSLIPTEIRNYGLGICSSAARFGSSLSPLVVQHGGSAWTPLPTVVSVGLLLVGILVSLTLPPTCDHLPDRISDLKSQKQSEIEISDL